MKCGIRMAVALGAGYLLGRIKTARRGARKLVPGDLVSKLVPGDLMTGELGTAVGELAETVRGDLLDAARSAATAAVISRIDSLSGTLHDRAETFRNPEAAAVRAGEAAGKAGQTAGRAAGQAAGRAGGAAGRLRRSGRGPGGEEDTGGAGPEEERDRDEQERGEGRGRRGRPRTRSARAESGETGEPEDAYDDEEDDRDASADEAAQTGADEGQDAGEDEAAQPAPRRRRASRSLGSRTRR